MSIWEKSNWRSKPRVQMPDYTNQQVLNSVEKQLASYPPLVFAGEARNLKSKLASAAKGEAFLLQGGDCAESFEQFSADSIRDTFQSYASDGNGTHFWSKSSSGKSRTHGRSVCKTPVSCY